MTGLRIVAKEHQGHAGHEPDILETLPLVFRGQLRNRGHESFAGGSQMCSLLKLESGDLDTSYDALAQQGLEPRADQCSRSFDLALPCGIAGAHIEDAVIELDGSHLVHGRTDGRAP